MTLNKVEKYLYENLVELAKSGYKDENPRAKYKDQTPSHTLSIRGGVYERYDISKCEFPITETRPIPWKSSIQEILAIYQSQTNTQEGFESHDVGWWKEWCNEEGNIGRAYAYNLESHRPGEMKREVVKVEKKIIDKKERSKILEPCLIFELEEEHSNSLPSIYVGELIENKYGNFKVLSKIEDDRFLIQFLDTGFKKLTSSKQIRNGSVKNPYCRTVCNFGYLGNYKSVKGFSESEIYELRKKWQQMIERCCSNNEKFKNWNKDMICTEWQSFEGFLKTIKKVPQYFIARDNNFKNYVLDKDYFGSEFYSPETSVFISISDNNLYYQKPFVDKSTGKIYISQIEYSNEKNEKSNFHVNNSLNNRGFKKYDIEFLNDGKLYRYELSRNQINYLLENLKSNPFSKRHIVSFYNWANIDKKMLVECAYETLWTVSEVNGKRYLDLTLIQRSSDLLVAGSGINQIQYVALQMMIAKHLGIEPGLFEHYRKNIHIYDRHLYQYKETLIRLEKLKERKEQSNVQLILNVPDKTNFYDIDIQHFELINYDPIKPQIKFDLGI